MMNGLNSLRLGVKINSRSSVFGDGPKKLLYLIKARIILIILSREKIPFFC